MQADTKFSTLTVAIIPIFAEVVHFRGDLVRCVLSSAERPSRTLSITLSADEADALAEALKQNAAASRAITPIPGLDDCEPVAPYAGGRR